jgi:hypothetical protein
MPTSQRPSRRPAGRAGRPLQPKRAAPRQLFGNGAQIMAKDAMLHFFFDNDRVTLITSQENAQDGVDH